MEELQVVSGKDKQTCSLPRAKRRWNFTLTGISEQICPVSCKGGYRKSLETWKRKLSLSFLDRISCINVILCHPWTESALLHLQNSSYSFIFTLGQAFSYRPSRPTVWLQSCFHAVSRWALPSCFRAKHWVKVRSCSGRNRFTLTLSICLAMNDSNCPAGVFWMVRELLQQRVISHNNLGLALRIGGRHGWCLTPCGSSL